MINEIFQKSGSEFPIKIGAKAEVQLYASRLVNGENQLLITYEGDMFLTLGNGAYRALSGSGIATQISQLSELINQLENRVEANEISSSDFATNITNGMNDLVQNDAAQNQVIVELTKKVDDFIDLNTVETTQLKQDIIAINNSISALHDLIQDINNILNP